MKKVLPYIFTPILAVTGCGIEEKPNVVLFFVDDLGWTDLSAYGSKFYQTPHIDQLAAEGMLFTDGYSSCTVCSPTRASIMTGKYPARIRLTTFIPGHDRPFARYAPPPDWIRYMDHAEYTLAEALKDEGYQTLHLGKWHLGEDEKYWPENRGFDTNLGGWSVGAPRLVRNQYGGYFAPYGNPRLNDGPEGEYLTERLAAEAVRFIEGQKNESSPFFLNFWFYTVHTPLQATDEKIAKYAAFADSSYHHHNPVYAAMVEHLDDAVGRVMQALKDANLDDNTIIIFTSDNGGLISQGNISHVTSNYPLRSGKGDMFEGGVRVPFIVRWNNKVTSNSVNSTPVISNDIYPTILGLTNSKGRDDQNKEMDGVDLTDLLLRGRSISREALYWHFPHYHPGGAEPYSSIRKGHWKLIDVFGSDGPMLFNLGNDIGEQHNMAAVKPDVVHELQTDLDNWRDALRVQLPIDNVDYLPEFAHAFLPGIHRGKTKAEFLEILKKERDN